MTKLKLTGDKEEIRRIFEDIKPMLPEILVIDEYDNRSGEGKSIYVTLKEPLQKDSENNLQDWMIIEYCKTWRTTPEIKKYFKLEYEATREICDRLFSSGALSRRLQDKSYAYIDRGIVHRCQDCISYHKITNDDCKSFEDPSDVLLKLKWNDYDGYCLCNPTASNIFGYKLVESTKLNECSEYTDIQTRLGDGE